MNKKEIINKKLEELSKSKFRTSFHLNKKMIVYVKEKGFETIKNHAYDFIEERLRPENPKNDGKQTPMKQIHSIFIAQHACACCCRSCLEKWHHIPKGKELSNNEINYIVTLLLEWIKRECKK